MSFPGLYPFSRLVLPVLALYGGAIGVVVSIGTLACNGSDSVLDAVGLSDVVLAVFRVVASGIGATAIAVVSEKCRDERGVFGLSVTSSAVEVLLSSWLAMQPMM